MANHGYCKNCWWYKETHTEKYAVLNGRIQRIDGSAGRCYMQNGDGTPYKEVIGSSYCPDYINRKKGNRIGKQTLEEWINE